MGVIEKLTNTSFGYNLLRYGKLSFTETDTKEGPGSNQSGSNIIMSLVTTVITIFALYLAFKCKKDGKIDIVQILLACCCSVCYIPYRLAVPCK